MKKAWSFSSPAMDSTDELLISEVDGELECVLQQADRRALGAIDPNAADAAADAFNPRAEQVSPARF